MDTAPPRLPGAHRAVVPIEKVRDYALSPDHPQGRHQARVFAAVLGVGRDDAAWVREQILAEIRVTPAVPRRSAPGTLYEAVLWPRGPGNRRAPVRTAWLIGADGGAPRLVTAYIDTKATTARHSPDGGGEPDEPAGQR